MMAEDNVSSKLGVMFGLDENINQLHATNLVSHSTQREDNQNLLFTNSHAVSIIQKLTKFKELSSNISNTYKSIDQHQNISLIQNSSSYQNSNSMSSTLLLNSKVNVMDNPDSVNDFNINPTNSVPSTDTLYQDDVGKEYQTASHPDYSKTELLQDSAKTKKFSKSEHLKQALNSSNLFENHSEAGPDVAEFSEEELRSVAELFKEPSAFEFFQKASNSKILRESPLGRLSQFIKLDSSYKAEGGQDSGLDISGDSTSLNAVCGDDKDDEIVQSNTVMTTDSSGFISEDVKTNDLINMTSTSPKKMDKTGTNHQQNPHCVQESKLFTEEEFTQALKMQELLFHEKQLKRDKERGDQVKLLERDKQVLKNQVVALSKGYRASRSILEELLNIFTMWLTAKEKERVDMTTNNQKLIKERDQALEDLQNVESAFADLHRRYENCKSVLEGYKQNEERMKHQVSEVQVKLKQQEQMYEMLRSRIQDKLDSANAEIENARRSGDAEVTVLRAQLKKAEMRVSSLERDLEQKNKENVELSNICDDLIAKVGKT